MKILAIDTSTEACSAALLIDNAISERFEIAARRHAEIIIPMVDSLLLDADLKLSQLDAIGFSRGPGSFTGLRIAAGVVQGLAIGADLPVVPISTLAALSLYAYEEKKAQNVMACLDARMNEVYWGLFRYNSQGIGQLENEERLCLPSEVLIPEKDQWFGVGPGWTRYAGEFNAKSDKSKIEWENNVLPQARYVASLAGQGFLSGKVVAPEDAVPVYLRDNVAKKVAKKRTANSG